MISVIIPVYNCENYLEECLGSICNQTYGELEIILIDDGSKDRSADICDDYSKRDSRIRVVHIENSGASHARNIGLSMAKGEYIGFVDSDDEVTSNMFEFLYKKMIEFDVDGTLCGYTKIGHAYDTEVKEKVLKSGESIKSVFLDEYYGKYQGYIWNRLFKKKIIEENKIKFNEKLTYSEDKLFLCQYLSACSKIYYSTLQLYNYRVDNDSLTTSINHKKSAKDEIEIYSMLMKILNVDEDVLKVIEGWHYQNCIAKLWNAFKKRDSELKKLVIPEVMKIKTLSAYKQFCNKKQYFFWAFCKLYYKIRLGNKYEQ